MLKIIKVVLWIGMLPAIYITSIAIIFAFAWADEVHGAEFFLVSASLVALIIPSRLAIRSKIFALLIGAIPFALAIFLIVASSHLSSAVVGWAISLMCKPAALITHEIEKRRNFQPAA